MRLGGAVDTLLGPEETSPLVVGLFSVQSGLWPSYRLGRVCCACGWVSGGGGWGCGLAVV